MKKILSLKLVIFLILLMNTELYADDIWSKNFSDDLNKGYWGTANDMGGVSDWSLDVSMCTLSNDSDYVKVVETSGGRLEAVDCDGEAIWTSKVIDISGFTNCSISLLAKETGSSTNSNKYIKCYYQLDDGTEVSFDSNWENIGNWGSSNVSASNLEGNELRIVIKLNNPNSGDKVYFDDIVVAGDPVVVENDKLTEIKESQNQIGEVIINTNVDTEKEAVACFRFIIDETDSAQDGVPTKISRMTFYNSKPKNGINWETQLGGVLMFLEDQQIDSKLLTISSDSLFFDFSENQLSIPEGEKREIELRIYLNSDTSLGDGEKFQCFIAETARGFESFSNGSGFLGNNELITSVVHSIDVKASKLIIDEIPGKIVRNQFFNVGLNATDQFGNIDLDQQEKLHISLFSGKGELLSENGFEKLLNSGTVTFDFLRYQIIDTIQLAIKGESLPKLISSDIIIENTYESQAKTSSWIPNNTLLSSTRTNKVDAFEIFRFTVHDSGGDETPTILKKIPIITSDENQIDLKKSLTGFYLMREGVELDADIKVSKNRIDILFPDNELTSVVESESSAEYSVYAYFKEGACVDGETIQVKIERSSKNWEVLNSESGLKPIFDNDILGPRFVCDVEAIKMKFSEVPKYVKPNEKFAIGLELLDAFGNPDTNFDKLVTISLAAGTGELNSQSGLSKSIENGKLEWTDLLYGKAENFTIQAETDGFETILSDNISSVDRNSSLSFGDDISTTQLNSKSISEALAITILNFTITDSASFDELPTIVNTAKFYKKESINSFDWKKHIAGAIVKSEGEIIAQTSDIESDYIKFNSAKGIFTVDNGTSKNFELAIYFRKSQLPDNYSFKLHIPDADFGWKTGVNSSELIQNISSEISSGDFQLNVVADRLKIVSSPMFITDSTVLFDMKVVACDQYQNIDKDNSDQFTVSVMNGNGKLAHDNDLILNKGVLQINSMKYNGDKDFKIRVNSNLLSDTCSIKLGANLLDYDYDFEKNNLEEFINTDDWSVSSYQPIKDEKSLKHNLSNQVGSSFISRELNNWKPENGASRWSFILKNGDWDPSSGNHFVFHLYMDNEDPARAQTKYSIGINLKGSTDLLSLWRTDSEPELLLETAFNWNEKEEVAIQVDYTADGKWQLAYNRLGEENNWYKSGSVYSAIVTDANSAYSALEFNFESASRAGELWFDKLKIQSVNTAPFIKSYQVAGQDSFLIEFSEELDANQLLGKENFTINLNGEDVSDYSVTTGNEKNKVLLLMNSELVTGLYRIEISNIKDEQGAILDYDFIEFEYLAPAKIFDVVINEIMADENPTNGLPEYEYIELHNTKDYPISVENWKLQIGKKELFLSGDTIQANSYLILCSNSAVDAFTKYGNTLGLSSFTGLTNAGASLQLKSAKEKIIDEIAYSDTWYKSKDKSDGGWSLERID
ncbi:MAG: lamin tail domain-containing protein, partial [Marinifilum sp.]|nr:lamin tail domain-containing protein [Marinifilum sp.]